MRTVLLFIAIFGLSSVGAEGAIQTENHTQSRNLGGEQVTWMDMDFFASLWTTNGEYFCSAFIYNRRWMLTTATCVWRRNLNSFVGRLFTDSISQIGHLRNFEHMVIHPEFNDFRMMNNIALLRTVGVTTDFITGSALRIYNNVVPAGTVVRVIGWGATVMKFILIFIRD